MAKAKIEAEQGEPIEEQAIEPALSAYTKNGVTRIRNKEQGAALVADGWVKK